MTGLVNSILAFGLAVVASVVGYWLTNGLGFVLMDKGAKTIVSGDKTAYAKSELVKDFSIACYYPRVDQAGRPQALS